MNPRQRFRSNPDFLRQWPGIVDQHITHEALYAAFNEMVVRQAKPSDTTEAAANDYRKQGVLEYISILTQLADPEPKPAKKAGDNLDHRV